MILMIPANELDSRIREAMELLESVLDSNSLRFTIALKQKLFEAVLVLDSLIEDL